MIGILKGIQLSFHPIFDQNFPFRNTEIHQSFKITLLLDSTYWSVKRYTLLAFSDGLLRTLTIDVENQMNYPMEVQDI